MVRIVSAALAAWFWTMGAASAGAQTPAWREESVSLPAGEAMLHGTLTQPSRPSAGAPAVLLIAGSGPTDRDGNSALGVRAATLKLLAHGLAERGIASLRYDKRGIADSAAAAPAESELRFATYVQDATLWAKTLKARTGARCVVLAGHSEGALVAALAAPGSSDICGVVSISGAGRPAGVVLREQLTAGLPDAMRPAALRVLSELEAGRTVADPPPALAALFRPSVQPYLISWLPLDPVAALKAAGKPTLVLQGAADIQIPESDARLLAGALPGAKLTILPGVNHVLKVAPAERAANAATYADPTLALAPGVVGAVAGFVLALPRKASR